MERPMIGFGIDDEGDWFAFLSCGHRQHVRHRPPFINRPWVTTASGRNSRLGRKLDCVRCDRLELPDTIVWHRRTAEFTEHDIPAASVHLHAADEGMWIRIIVSRGRLRCRLPELDIDMLLAPDDPGTVPPQTTHRIEQAGSAVFHLEMYRVPKPTSA